MDELEQAIGAAVPPHLRDLAPQDRCALATAVERAVTARSELIDDSLRHLPALGARG